MLCNSPLLECKNQIVLVNFTSIRKPRLKNTLQNIAIRVYCTHYKNNAGMQTIFKISSCCPLIHGDAHLPLTRYV